MTSHRVLMMEREKGRELLLSHRDEERERKRLSKMMSFNQSKHVNTKTFGHISMVQHLMVK